jgi:SulP family sulfate permease
LLPDLNSALEACENELLKTLYARQEAVKAANPAGSASLEVPTGDSMANKPLDQLASSPRRSHLYEAAARLVDAGKTRQSKWQSFKEPLRLMLQIFQDLGGKNEDFWFRAAGYFTRKEYQAGDVLYRQGDAANGFFLVESGIIRMDYDLPQGYLCESIVAGTTCGELPFFSETNRTATAIVERDCVVWLIDREGWARLQKEELDVAQELLRMGLKLTSERMNVMTSYVLTVAS